MMRMMMTIPACKYREPLKIHLQFINLHRFTYRNIGAEVEIVSDTITSDDMAVDDDDDDDIQQSVTDSRNVSNVTDDDGGNTDNDDDTTDTDNDEDDQLFLDTSSVDMDFDSRAINDHALLAARKIDEDNRDASCNICKSAPIQFIICEVYHASCGECLYFLKTAEERLTDEGERTCPFCGNLLLAKQIRY